jgi:23S rRNA (guanine745-N1)-methyltransferase
VRVTLLCTVRSCASPLAASGRSHLCANGHSFDLARSGYLNLLQPQDRRSSQPGDTPAAVAARRRFLTAHGSPLDLSSFFAEADTLLDVGCGEGHHLSTLPPAVEAHGVDISVPAIDAAAHRYRDAFFTVANADRFLPYADASFAAVTSITSRMNPPEFRRVLRPEGRLLLALPAPDDLLELRAAVLGSGEERSRVSRTVDLFAPLFTLVHQERVHHTAHLDHQSIEDVMTSSYRGLRTRERERMAAVDGMEVTMSRDVLVFAPR